MIYLNDIECPAELPSDMRAFKSQQHRWAKGGVQVMKKLWRTIWNSNFRFGKKLEASFHLSNNFAYLVMLVDTLFLLLPSLIIREQLDIPALFWFDILFLMLSSISHLVYLYYGQVALGKPRIKALTRLPLLLMLGISLAFNNARAALEALLNQESEFVRTPKSGEVKTTLANEDTLIKGKVSLEPSLVKKYSISLPSSEGIELAVTLVFALCAVWAVQSQNWHMLPFLCLLSAGFALSAINSFKTRPSSAT